MQEAFSAVHIIPPFNGDSYHAYSNPIGKLLHKLDAQQGIMDFCLPSIELADGHLCLQVGSGERPWVSMRAWMPKGCDKMPSHAPASSVPWQRASNGPLHYRYASFSKHTTSFCQAWLRGYLLSLSAILAACCKPCRQYTAFITWSLSSF